MNKLKIIVRYPKEKNTKQKATKANDLFPSEPGHRSTRILGPSPWAHGQASPFPIPLVYPPVSELGET